MASQWFTWESNFKADIDAVRERELRTLRTYMLFEVAMGLNWALVPTLVGVVTFLTHTQVGLDAPEHQLSLVVGTFGSPR